MTRLVRAEWTKLFTTRAWLGLLLGACVMVIGFAVLLTAFAGDSQSGIPPVESDLYQQLAAANPANVAVLFLILGILGTTQEYRHRTATPTFLTTPRRGRVVLAKLVAYALAAAPLALVVLLVNAVTVAVVAGARGAAPGLSGDPLRILASSGLALVVYALVGVGIGALLRNQIGAIVASLVYLFVAEPLIRQIGAVSDAYKWMPGGALEALTATFQGPDLLRPWQGGLVLLGYGLLAAVLGTFLAVRRDVA